MKRGLFYFLIFFTTPLIAEETIQQEVISIDGQYRKKNEAASDRLKKLRRKLEIQNELMVKKKIENLRLQQELEMTKRIQKIFADQMKQLEKL